MKNKIFKISIFIFFAFIVSFNVKALVKDNKCLELKMTSPGDPAHFDTKVKYCKWVGPVGYVEVKGKNGTHFPTIEEALAVGQEEIYLKVYIGGGTDEKGLSTGGGEEQTIKAKRCDSNLAKVRIYFSCTKTINKSYHPDSGNCGKNHNETCGDAYYYCPDGTIDSGKGTCIQTYNGKQEVEKTGSFNPSKAANEAGDGYTASKCKAKEHALLCPEYKCEYDTKEISACAPEYQYISGEDMYCVSPGLHFTSKEGSNGFGRSNTQGYQVDEDFDYRNCTNSYVNDACGFSNILIESKWLKKYGTQVDYNNLLDYQTINLAMRLYGAHTSTRGFDNVSGLGIYYGSPGQDACTEMTVYDLTPSVYSITEEVYITNKYLDYITEKYTDSYLEAGSFLNDTFFDLSCNKLGLICRYNNSERYKHVRLALGLFFNTITGNTKMVEHIEDLYGVRINEIESAELISTSNNENESKLVVTYGDIHFDKLESSVEYSCKEEDLAKLDKEIAERIRPYCTLKMIYTDSTGNKYNIRPEHCSGKRRFSCTSEVIPVAVCDKNRSWQKITYEYPDSSNGGPERLISCDNPEENQFMYGIIDSSKEKDPGNETHNEPKEKTIYIDSLECKRPVTCTDLQLRESKISCKAPSSESEYKEKLDGDVVTGYINDPSLKCILNSSSESRNKYDYSDLFGVNTNLCRVYCSDEIKYYIPDKTTIKNGLAFSYDIAARSYLNIDTDYKISNVVKEKRSCVSEIYYNNDFYENIAWDKIYGLTLDFISSKNNGKNISNFKELYKVISKAEKQKVVINGKEFKNTNKEIKENLNELIYDLYNCNFFGENVFESNKITKPRQRMFGEDNVNENVFDTYIKKEFSRENAYGLHGGSYNNNSSCVLNDNGTLSCMQMDTISYKGGSLMTNGRRIGLLINDNKIMLSNVSNSSRSKVTYCKDETNKKCFEYAVNTIRNSKEDLDSYEYIGTNSSNTYYDFNGRKVLIPTNDYAMFDVTTEVGFYNKDVFQPEPSTGYIKKIESDVDNNRLIVDRFSYPVSKDAYSICDIKYDNGNNVYYDPSINKETYKPSNYNNCKVTHLYSNLNTYSRKQFSDKLQIKISNYQPQCYYEVAKNQPQCQNGTACLKSPYDIAEYRNVDRSNMFPNENLGVNNTNWDTEEGQAAKNSIETADTDIFTNDNYLEYSFELTPSQLKKIRSYNRKASQYVEVKVDNCEITDKGIYLNCRSVVGGLLDEIRKSANDGSNTGYATILKNKDGSQLFYHGE